MYRPNNHLSLKQKLQGLPESEEEKQEHPSFQKSPNQYAASVGEDVGWLEKRKADASAVAYK